MTARLAPPSVRRAKRAAEEQRKREAQALKRLAEAKRDEAQKQDIAAMLEAWQAHLVKRAREALEDARRSGASSGRLRAMEKQLRAEGLLT